MKQLILNEEGKEIGYYLMDEKDGGIQMDMLWIYEEHRGKGYGTKTVKELLEKYDFIKAPVDGTRPIQFWKRFNPKITEDFYNIHITK